VRAVVALPADQGASDVVSPLSGGHATVEDVAMQSPLPVFTLPDDDVFALVEDLSVATAEREG
jgi:hypothetical protein